ncbi:MAG: hypothetical protein SGI92_32920, partial [Bryobacteraceae bacterium]|nr:hypothetical protein [Bryobacteraceae bacterium]
GYSLERRMPTLATHKSPEVRAKVYSLASEYKFPSLVEAALGEIRSSRAGEANEAIEPAVQYALEHVDDGAGLARRLLGHPNQTVSRSAVEAMVHYPEIATGLITREWIEESAASPDAHRRVLAAAAVAVHGDADTRALSGLLHDSNIEVAKVAARTAGRLQNRTYLDGLLHMLAFSRLRPFGVDALASFGDRVVGTLADVLLDLATPVSVRRQVPRVLRSIPTQRSVDVLLSALNQPDLTIRDAALRALNTLRETKPKLNYGQESLTQLILNEARYYYEMSAALAPFKEAHETPVARLLHETLETRLRGAIARLFRLLGLRYPPREIYAAYLAVNRKKTDEYTAAIDFLDNVLDRELKRYVMPLLDEDAHTAQTARDLFGVAETDAAGAIRSLLRSGDNWLVACAVATAGEMQLPGLRSEIEALASRSGTDVAPVAQKALLQLAA